MTRKWRGLILLSMLALLGCQLAATATPPPTPTPTPDLTAESYLVYNAAIQTLFPEKPEQLVIDALTATDFSGTPEGRGLPVDKALIAEYQARNAQPVRLETDRFNAGTTVTLLEADEKEAIFQDDQGWDRFYERFPGSQGIMTLSAVAFNAELTQALVYLGNQSYWLAGAGYYIVLAKENGLWVVKEQQMAWIS